MGGELQACGCFDGPFSEEDQQLVSVRCLRHFGDVPARPGYVLLSKDAVHYAVSRAERLAARMRSRGTMARSIKSKRRR